MKKQQAREGNQSKTEKFSDQFLHLCFAMKTTVQDSKNQSGKSITANATFFRFYERSISFLTALSGLADSSLYSFRLPKISQAR